MSALWVNLTPGVPAVSDFMTTGGQGGCLCVNVATNQGYYLKAGDVVTALAGGGGGTGTVTSVSVTTANGVSGVVATSTVTPAITITLGAITPTSVAATGTVTGSNFAGTHSGASSGTNTGDQTITLTGNVTGTGTGSFVTTIAAGVVTLAMQANMATGSLVYRKTALAGAPETQTLATLKTDLGLTGTNSGDQTITLTSDVTGSGVGSFATTIAAGVVTLAKQANLVANSIQGNNTGAGATPLALTGTQVTAMLDNFTSTLKGLAPFSGGGTTNFLRADGTWAAPPAGGAGTTTNALTMNNGGAGAVSGTTFNGSVIQTISYNTIGAAPLVSPPFTGTPTAPTAAFPTITTQLATTAYVDNLRDIPQNSQIATYTLALVDRGKHISITTGGITVPANASTAFPIGSTISIFNNSAVSQTIAITTDTMYLAGTATVGTRTLAQRGLATVVKVTSTAWVISGAGLT